MKELSHALIQLYEMAESVPVSAFAQETARLLRTLFLVDAVVIGRIEAAALHEAVTMIGQAFLFDRAGAMHAQAQTLGGPGTALRNILNELALPLCASSFVLLQPQRLPGLADLAEEHELQQLMLYGSTSEQPRQPWLVLARRMDTGFTHGENLRMQALWPHVVRAMQSNRLRHLERQLVWHESRAAALVCQQGYIEAADARFLQLLERELRFAAPERLPPRMLERLGEGQDFDGQAICISAFFHGDFMVCKAAEISFLGALTPAELSVAQHFSRGLTHKDVALKLGVSQNTVKTHIKHVYDKLAINSKLRLAQLMDKHKAH